MATFLLPSFLTAQIIFERTYGGPFDDYGHAVQQTSDRGYIVVGSTDSSGANASDFYLIRTDTCGDTLWTRTFGGDSNDCGESVRQTADGGYIIAGYTSSYGSGGTDVYLVKTDAGGETLWTRTFGGPEDDLGRSVGQTADGGYIIAGDYYSPRPYPNDVYLVKTDANGDALWTKTIGPHGGCAWGCSVQPTADGGYVVAGYNYRSGNFDVYLIKTDANGDTLWTRTYVDRWDDYGYSVQPTADGGYVIAGVEVSPVGQTSVYGIKTDADGDTLWTRHWTNWHDPEGRSVQPTADGGYIIAGSTGFDDRDVYLIKTDSHGDTLWTRTFGGGSTDCGWSVQPTADGGYVIAGYTESFGAGGTDVYLIKADSLGVAIEEPKTSPTRAQGLTLTCEPNPCHSSAVLHLTTGPLDHWTTLRIFDASGRRIWSEPVRSSSLILHPSSLPAGAYFLRLDAGDLHATTRLVVQR